MPGTVIKSIKLKLVLKKNSYFREAVFDTYCAMVESASEYEKAFMAMRQEEYYNQARELVTSSKLEEDFRIRFPHIKSDSQRNSVKNFLNHLLENGNSQYIVAWCSELFGTYRTPENKRGGRKPKNIEKALLKREQFNQHRLNFAKNKIFPLLTPLITQNLQDPIFDEDSQKFKLSMWERAAARVSVAHLLSWARANASTQESYAAQLKLTETLKTEYERQDHNLKTKIESYLKERKEESTGFESSKNFYITPAMGKGLTDVLKFWKQKDCVGENGRMKALSKWYYYNRKIGDPNFYHWLLKDENADLRTNTEFLLVVIRYHAAQIKLERMVPGARYTFPDIRLSPRWPMYEYKGGTNLKKYELVQENNELTVNLPLLQKKEDGRYEEINAKFILARSKQFEIQELCKKQIKFKTNDEVFTGKLGGGYIMVKLEGRSRKIQSAYLVITVQIDKKVPFEHFEHYNDKIKFHFQTGYTENKTSYSDEILNYFRDGSPIRVLSVNLGPHPFAACSIFKLTEQAEINQKKLKFPVYLTDNTGRGNELDVVHESSFPIVLPGEKVSDQVIWSRNQAMYLISELNQDIDTLNNILKMINQPSMDKKREMLEARLKYLKDETYLKIINDIKRSGTVEEFNNIARSLFIIFEKYVATGLMNWRRETRGVVRNRPYFGGKSLWQIEYLTEVRKLLTKWVIHTQEPGQVKRSGIKKYGHICRGLLAHIRHLKEARIKSGVSMLLRAARGYIYDKGSKKWIQKYQPCNLIIFKDLSLYLASADKKENAGHMNRSNRSVITRITEQAKLYGIRILDNINPFYTGMFCAKNNAPGIRAKSLNRHDFISGKLNPYITLRLREFYSEDQIRKLKPENIIPWNEGELFISIENGRIIELNADINAAWNLQRCFWGRHSDLLYFKPALSGKNLVIDGEASKRFPGALRLHGFNPSDCGLLKTPSGNYRLTHSKKDKAEMPPGNQYPPALFRDGSKKEKNSGLIFMEKRKFEKVVRAGILKKLKELTFGPGR